MSVSCEKVHFSTQALLLKTVLFVSFTIIYKKDNDAVRQVSICQREDNMKDRYTYTVKVRCISCRRVHPFQVHSLIDPKFDKNAEKKIYSGAYFEVKCPYCQYTVKTSYACMYHDGSRNLLIGYGNQRKDYKTIQSALMKRSTFDAAGDRINQWLDSCTIRIVRSEYELQEKVLIAHFGLDDRFVELARYEVLLSVRKQRRGVKNLLFNAEDGKYIFIIVKGSEMHEKVELTEEMRDYVMEKYKDVLENDDAMEVNEKWAKKQYRKDS